MRLDFCLQMIASNYWSFSLKLLALREEGGGRQIGRHASCSPISHFNFYFYYYPSL